MFDAEAPVPAPPPSAATAVFDHDVGVVGAGFAGLVAGLELIRAGRPSFAIFERAAEVGGVWRDNVYPGCACDIRSHLYSIAAWPEPGWRRSYARQGDILAYLKDVSARSGLDAHLRLGAEVAEARWQGDRGGWRLLLADGAVVHVRSLILATGPLNRPALPTLPGLDRFKGGVMHSSAWRDDIVLDGKRVGVVGTGASAVQIVPNIAPHVGQLVVFQRSAAWVMPRGDRAIGPVERGLYRRLPGARALARQGLFWLLEAVGLAFFGRKRLHGLLKAVALRKLRREVRDPVVRAALTPDYPLGCKRMTVSDDYLPAFNRDNVALVAEPIAAVEADGVRTASGRWRLDHIIFATGFVVADPDGFLRVVGEGGRVLSQLWAAEGAQGYLGVTLSGFPNLAMLLGPNSGLSYSSVVHVMESQMRYVRQWLDARDRAGATASLDVRPEVQAAYNADLQSRLTASMWNAACPSWYIDRAGRNTVIYPGLSSAYRRRLSRFDAADYRVSLAG